MAPGVDRIRHFARQIATSPDPDSGPRVALRLMACFNVGTGRRLAENDRFAFESTPLVHLKIYLAGPEVFLPDAREIGLRKKILCEEFGFVGLYPLDNDPAFASGEGLDEKIFAANLAFLSEADAAIFNLSPFRGVNADAGTAFELGVFTALGKPMFAYSNHAEAMFGRVAAEFGVHATPEGAHCDARGLLIENFGNADNLMLDCALKAQGRRVVRPGVSSPELGDLTGFTACLRQARLHFAL